MLFVLLQSSALETDDMSVESYTGPVYTNEDGLQFIILNQEEVPSKTADKPQQVCAIILNLLYGTVPPKHPLYRTFLQASMVP